MTSCLSLSEILNYSSFNRTISGLLLKSYVKSSFDFQRNRKLDSILGLLSASGEARLNKQVLHRWASVQLWDCRVHSSLALDRLLFAGHSD